jgi:hypothetical protein
LSAACDRLIAHPNVMNGAQLYWPMENVLYVEGYGLDRFARGDWGLQPVFRNRIGIVLDRGIEPDLQLRHLQAVEAARATLGLEIGDYVITDRPLEVTLNTAASGASWGAIAHPDSLLRSAERLIYQARATAIAIVARFPDDSDSSALQAYRQGRGVDPLAGAEAVISHLVVREFQIPAAHAPALAPLPVDASLSPKSAAEELGYTFFPCVLVGLSRAPQFVEFAERPVFNDPSLIHARQVSALLVPETAFGGIASLALSQQADLVLAIADNQTQMRSPPEAFGIKAIRVNSYLEAIGAISAHRAGVSPASLSSHIPSLRPLPNS